MTSPSLRSLGWTLVAGLTSMSCLLTGESDFKVASIEVFGNSEVKANESITLHTLLKNKGGSTIEGTVTWSSSSPTVASVNSGTGVVTGVQERTATITATATSGATGSKVLRHSPAAVAAGDGPAHFLPMRSNPHLVDTRLHPIKP